MRVPPSHKDNLYKDGANMRIYHDTRAKLRTLASLRGQTMADTIDALIDAALQAEYDRIAAAPPQEPPQ